jgi:hypothetical protein
LRVAFRKQRPIKSRFKITAILAALTGFFMLIGLIDPAWAKILNSVLFFIGLMFVARALRVCAGLFSEERRNQTLELLFLTGMTSSELFTTKLLGGILVASSDLLALMPFLAIPFLAGGLTMHLFVATLVCLPTLLAFVLAVGVLVSVICSDDGTAFMAATIGIVVLCVLTPVPYNIGLRLTSHEPFSSAWLSLSPAYAPWLIAKSFGASFSGKFWSSIIVTLSWALVCLAIAATILTRNWRQEPAHHVQEWRQIWQRWVHGTNQWRIALRHSVLARNAFRWRLEQDRRPTLRAWVALSVVINLWVVGWIAWRDDWLSTTNFFAIATVLVLAFYWLELYAAAHQIARERRDGTLELLLTTPLAPGDIVDGQLEACRRQSRGPRLAAMAFFLLLATLGYFVRQWNPTAIAVYLIGWALLCWFVIAQPRKTLITAIWVALISGRAAYSVFRIHGFNYGWLWMFYNFYRVGVNFGNSAAQFPKGTLTEIVIVSIIGVVTLFVAFFGLGRTKLWCLLLCEMRAIAREPVPDPDDPRFKKWKDIKQPFPSAA